MPNTHIFMKIVFKRKKGLLCKINAFLKNMFYSMLGSISLREHFPNILNLSGKQISNPSTYFNSPSPKIDNALKSFSPSTPSQQKASWENCPVQITIQRKHRRFTDSSECLLFKASAFPRVLSSHIVLSTSLASLMRLKNNFCPEVVFYLLFSSQRTKISLSAPAWLFLGFQIPPTHPDPKQNKLTMGSRLALLP